MRVTPSWTKEEQNVSAKYSKIPEIRERIEAEDIVAITRSMREETALLEKVLDTLELTDFKPDQMKHTADRLDISLSIYVHGILDSNINIDKNYLIWATIAVQRKHKMLGGKDIVKTNKVLTESILT